jgi:molecular chaperone HtpG
MTVIEGTKLGAWLLKEKPEYFYKAKELRDTVTGWLGYIVQTFPHYTRHTVDHSDNIVLQMSHLLFLDNRKKPEVPLSPIEAYVLIAAAYLHDAGMVVPDDEKRVILESDEWKSWIAGGASERWEKIRIIRDAAEPADRSVRDFLADLYMRHLIAEFVRRVHHKRAARVIAEHPATFEHFSLKDPLVARTIADVCIGHGLSHNELKDPSRYPEQRQLAGDHANVRWMAIMLRLGDLLDMRADRACPLLLNAAAPLPPESVVHWTQYQKLTHFLVAPKRIEISAECDTREEYQVLRDWCQWIEEEAKNAALMMVHVARHSKWKPPEPKIGISKSPTAKFLIEDWKFELDREAVFDRLIHDVYDEPITFIRELIQNALDATRVQMYLDLDADGLPRPEYPTQIEEARRERYPVEITLETRTIRNEHTGADEERQFFTITDHGVGMDRDIISRYLLQIGRSYYISDEFQRAFRFVPTSRFGIGFLSVFAVADQVTIDTYKPTSPAHDGPIQLTLRGVRNYVLPMDGTRDQRGTRIEVRLSKPIQAVEAVKAIEAWCRRVEVPIHVVTSDGAIVIRSETASDFEFHMPDLDTPGAEWHVRAYPFHDSGVEGELYVTSRSYNGVEEFGHDSEEYKGTHLFHPDWGLSSDLSCLHGISTRLYPSRTSTYWSYRIDVRRPSATTLSRTRVSHRDSVLPEVQRALEIVIQTHLEQCPSALGSDAWRYLQRLADVFAYPTRDFWRKIPMIPTASSLGVSVLTLAEIAAEPGIITGFGSSTIEPSEKVSDFDDVWSIATSEETIRNWAVDRRHAFAAQVNEERVRVWVKWGPVDVGNADFTFAYAGGVTVVLLPIVPSRVALIAAKPSHFIINCDHPLADWIRAARRAVESGTLTEFSVGDLLDDIGRAARTGYPPNFRRWHGPSVPAELQPPPLDPIMDCVLGSPEPNPSVQQ